MKKDIDKTEETAANTQAMVSKGVPTPGNPPPKEDPDINGTPVPLKTGPEMGIKEDKDTISGFPVKSLSKPVFGSLTEALVNASQTMFGLPLEKLAQKVKYMKTKDYSVKVKGDGKDIDRRHLKDPLKCFFKNKKKEKPPTLLDNIRDSSKPKS